MSVKRYLLAAKSPFHLGEPGIGQESTAAYLHSDTLFSAICTAIAELYGDTVIEAFLKSFAGSDEPPFVLSSAYPYWKEFYFYPNPRSNPLRVRSPEAASPDEQAMTPTGKATKNIEFVSEAVFKDLLKGQPITPPKDNLLQEGQLWVGGDEINQLKTKLTKIKYLWKKEVVPHVVVDRLTNEGALYFSGRMFFHPKEGGLHFLVRWNKAEQIVSGALTVGQLFEQALWYLSDAGIGGDRSSGHGQFQYPVTDEDLGEAEWLAAPTKVAINLSLYYPTEPEWATLRTRQRSNYTLSERTGWLSMAGLTSIERKQVWMLGEGAWLDFGDDANPGWRGKLAEVSPDWSQLPPESIPASLPKIYRNGYAFLVGVK